MYLDKFVGMCMLHIGAASSCPGARQLFKHTMLHSIQECMLLVMAKNV